MSSRADQLITEITVLARNGDYRAVTTRLLQLAAFMAREKDPRAVTIRQSIDTHRTEIDREQDHKDRRLRVAAHLYAGDAAAAVAAAEELIRVNEDTP